MPRRLLIRSAALLALLLLLLVAAVVVNTLRQPSRQLGVAPLPPLAVDVDAAAASLAVAVRAQTISDAFDPERNADQFFALHAHLQARYPKAHAALQREVVGGRSLLYTWPGSDPAARPIALLAHQDVVPLAPGTASLWTQPPFEGRVDGGFVWGRGAWDDKGNLVAQMEAVELLLAAGFKPRRTLHLVFGADEEVGGSRGAARIAALLQQRGVRLDFVVDEGLLIMQGILPGLDKPAALIGVAEKGYLSLQLKASGTPGHSSMPPPHGGSAIAILSAALQRLDAAPLPGGIRGIARELFDTVAPEMSGINRFALSNLWLFGRLVQRQLERSPSTGALLRTTTALTIFHAGNKDNVLPGQATATVNFRLLPGDTLAGVTEHARRTVADARVDIEPLPGASEPSAVSPTDAPSYRLLARTVRELFPGTVVAPGLMIGATDARHFAALADHIYRFSPVKARPEDLLRFHGTDERIALSDLADLIRFYHRLIRSANAEGPPP